MRDLLCADFARLWKNRPFLCCWAGMALFALFLTAEEYLEPYTVTLDRMVFLPLSLYGVVTGAFAGLFLGQDHAEGTAGRRRSICPAFWSRRAARWSSMLPPSR